jgi:hypothetical protein
MWQVQTRTQERTRVKRSFCKKWCGTFLGTVIKCSHGRVVRSPIFVKDLKLPVDRIRYLTVASLPSDSADWINVTLFRRSFGKWEVRGSHGRVIAYGPFDSCVLLIGLSRNNFVEENISGMKHLAMRYLRVANVFMHEPAKRMTVRLALRNAEEVASWIKGEFHSLINERAKAIRKIIKIS